MKANEPPELVGLSHLLDLWVGYSASTIALTLMAAATTLAICLSVRATHGSRALYGLITCITVLLFMVPLHTYDSLLIVPVALTAFVVAHPSRWLVAIGTLIAIRPGNIALITGIRNPDSSIFFGSTLTSIALLLIFIAGLWFAIDLRRSKVGSGIPSI